MGAIQDQLDCRIPESPHEAEELYRAYLANTVEGIWRLETEIPIPISLPEEAQTEQILRHGYVAQSNAAYARMHGFREAHDMTGRWLRDLLVRSGPQSLDLVRTFVRSAYRLVESELCLQDTNGGYRWYSVNMTGIVQNGQLMRAWGSQRDVTQRYRRIAEEWQTTFNAIRDPVMLVDRQRRITRANAAAIEFFGLAPDKIIGRPCHLIWTDVEVPWLDCPVTRAWNSRKHAEAEVRCERRGLWMKISADPVLDGYGGVTNVAFLLKDITEQKNWEDAVNRELLFERLFSGVSARLMQASGDEVGGEIRRALLALRQFHGLDCVCLLEVDAEQTVTAVVESVAAPDCESVLAAGDDLARTFPWLFRRVVHQGQCFAAQTLESLPLEANEDRSTCDAHGIRSFLAVPLSASAVVGYVILGMKVPREHPALEECLPQFRLMGEVLVNALGRRHAEAEAQRLRDQLAHVARAAALGELVAALAHELSQPLTAILSNAQAAQRQFSNGGSDLVELKEILADIVADNLRAGEVIRRLRTSLKQGPAQPQRLAVNSLVEEVARIVRNDALLRQVHLTVDLASGLPAVKGDPIQLEQVLINLVINGMDALEAAPAGERRLKLTTRRLPSGVVEVAVRDCGSGIPAAVLPQVFTPFFTTKAGGLGMGLAICRSIIEAHGGQIEAVNNPDAGATVRFTLPTMEEGL